MRLRCVGIVLFLARALPSCYAQDSVNMQMLVQPWNRVEYILNGHERLKTVHVRAVRLPVGEHRLIFWAPNCSILDTVLHVMPGQKTIELRKVLKRTPEYLVYQRKARQVWIGNALLKAVPALVTVGFGIKALTDHRAHDQAFDDLHALRDSYAGLTSPNDIQALKEQTIPAAQDNLDQTRKNLTVSMALCGWVRWPPCTVSSARAS